MFGYLRSPDGRARVCRAALLVEFQLPRGLLAPRGAGRARPAPGAARDRPDRSGRPLRRRSLRQSGGRGAVVRRAVRRGADAGNRGRGTDPGQPPGPAGQRGSDRHAAAGAHRRRQDGLRQPRAAALGGPAAGAQARRAPAARRPRGPHRRARRALGRAQRRGRKSAAAARWRRRGRAGRALARPLPRALLPRAAASRSARGSGADPRAGAPGDAARRAVCRDQRRCLRNARRRSALRRADVREVHDVAAERRDAAAAKPRARLEISGAHGPALRRVSARARELGGDRGALHVSPRQTARRVSALPDPAGRDVGSVVSAHAGLRGHEGTVRPTARSQSRAPARVRAGDHRAHGSGRIFPRRVGHL